MTEPASASRHWVRITTSCNNRCLFCLDADLPRDLRISDEEVIAEIDRGRDELRAERLILSGGEPTIHPRFLEFVRRGRSRGYGWVQAITNGHRFADRAFFEEAMDAGLSEITFSLHGDTARLHDRLTGTPGAFDRLVKGLARATRDGRPVVSVDVVLNGLNVEALPGIIALAASLGVTEFDLLQLIPQGAAFQNRALLRYDIMEHMPTLRRVFDLGRDPRFVIWTNRFPVAYLEGYEELIQDPEKLLDEVNGRRAQIRRRLDTGVALDCEDPERCPTCFVRPFCDTMDGILELVASGGAEARAPADPPVPVAADGEALEAWLTRPLPDGASLRVNLNRDTAPWLLANRALVAAAADRVELCQPSHARLEDARAQDLEDPRGFFIALDLPVRVAGLPACLAPAASIVEDPRVLPEDIFEPGSGRVDIGALARFHIVSNYRVKSLRCGTCSRDGECRGAHINLIRNLGLGILTPLSACCVARSVGGPAG